MISAHPPDSSGANISNTDTSKLAEVEASPRDSPAAPNAPAAHRARFTTPAWATTTPLGTPVDPEVYITYAAAPPPPPAAASTGPAARAAASTPSAARTGTGPPARPGLRACPARTP